MCPLALLLEAPVPHGSLSRVAAEVRGKGRGVRETQPSLPPASLNLERPNQSLPCRALPRGIRSSPAFRGLGEGSMSKTLPTPSTASLLEAFCVAFPCLARVRQEAPALLLARFLRRTGSAKGFQVSPLKYTTNADPEQGLTLRTWTWMRWRRERRCSSMRTRSSPSALHPPSCR
jgi:hypothetical protein